jgi:hypothetical protein
LVIIPQSGDNRSRAQEKERRHERSLGRDGRVAEVDLGNPMDHDLVTIAFRG